MFPVMEVVLVFLPGSVSFVVLHCWRTRTQLQNSTSERPGCPWAYSIVGIHKHGFKIQLLGVLGRTPLLAYMNTITPLNPTNNI